MLTFDDTSARSAITGAGLTVGSVSTQANCDLTKDGVITQSPMGGASAVRGDPVSLVESTGRQPSGKLCVIR